MSRFGTYLQKLGLLTVEQLDAALAHQAEHGARLGTNLVELKRIDVDLLGECLSGYHAVPLPPRKWLQRPQRGAVKRVTRALVERVRFVPLRLDGTTLHVAVMDPRDPRVLDDLRFASGCKIEPYVLPEIWMHDWLQKLFGIPRAIRHVETGSSSSAPPELDPTYDFQAVQITQPQAPQAPPPPQPPPLPAQAARTGHRSGGRRPAPPSQAPARASAAQERASAPPARAAAQQRANAPAASASDMNASAWQSAPAWGSIVPPQAAPASISVGPLAQSSAGAEQPTAGPSLDAFVREPEVSSLWERRPVFNWNVPEEPAQTSSPPPSAPPRAQSGEIAAPVEGSGIQRPARHAAGELAQLEAALLQVEQRERLIELSFAIGTSFAATLALFVVQRGTVQGLQCITRGAPRPIDGVLPLDPPCMLIDAATATEPVRASPAHASDQRVLQLLDDTDAAEVALFPVAIKGRVVNVLYASNGNQPLGAIAFAALGALTRQMGAAYEQLIMIRKTANTSR